MTPTGKLPIMAVRWHIYGLMGPRKRPETRFMHERNFYKLEKWTKDGTKVDSLLSGKGARPFRQSYQTST
jgi:hypothetical protein